MKPEDKVEKKNDRKKSKNTGGAIIIGTIFVAIIILLLVFSLQGKTTTSGNYPENVSDEALSCTATNIDYPFFVYDNSYKKEAEINVLFSKDKMKSIALAYSLYYNDKTSITGSEAHNHAAMNISFGKNGLGADALGATYAKLDSRMQMSLYVTKNNFEGAALKYFLVDRNEAPDGIESYQNIYRSQGFKCEIK